MERDRHNHLLLLGGVAAAFDDKKRAGLLYEMLRPAAADFTVLAFASAFREPVARPLALLAATLGRYDEAVAHFEFALRQNERVGALPFVVQTQYDYSRFLLGRASEGDREQADLLLSEAAEVASRLGYRTCARSCFTWNPDTH